MKKTILSLLLILSAVFLFTACPVPLSSSLPADLVLTLGRFNSTGGLTNLRAAVGGTLSVPVLITDQTGKETTTAYSVLFTLSVDADLETTADNTEVGTESVTAGTETVLDLTVPAAITAAGTYYLFGAIDAADAAENNNTAYIEVVLGTDNLPDLEISLSATPDWALPEGSINVGYRIDNTGYAAVASGTEILVEFTVTISGAPETMGTETITLAEDLYPQDFITSLLAVTVPSLGQMAADDGVSTTDLGLWSDGVFTATVDPDDTIDEIVEGGTDTFTIFSGNKFPDLVMSDIILPNSFEAARIGDPVELTLKVSNNGAAATGDYTIDLYVDINTNGTYDDGTDLIIKQWTSDETPVVPYDMTGSGYNVVYINTKDLGLTYPDAADGTYNFRAELTAGTDVTEYNTGNNTATENGVLYVKGLYDFEMESMSSTLAAVIDETAGGTIPLTYTLVNNGPDNFTGSFDVSFYATADATINTGTDILLGTDALSSVTIASDGTLTETYSATFPASQGAGFYTLYWVIDSSNDYFETDENNNRPTVNECYVFPLVGDGTTDTDARLVSYKPLEAEADYKSIWAYLYNDTGTNWNSYEYDYGSTTNPGTQYGYTASLTLTQGTVGGISIEPGFTDVPVAFRLVPGYVTDIPSNALPTALTAQDGFEGTGNNTEGTAAALSGTNSPFFGFVNVWLDYYDDETDYFTFDVP